MESVKDAHRDHRYNICKLRFAIVEAFMGICVGVSKVENDEHFRGNQAISVQNEAIIFKNMENMFYYIEKLIVLEDLEITPALVKEIIDLYCDICVYCFQHETFSRNSYNM